MKYKVLGGDFNRFQHFYTHTAGTCGNDILNACQPNRVRERTR